ncbi:MAG: GNAT family N-acetyltransferase [Eubacteriales bacterium]|nr:GNAT family N-acetyltransferase [Eubacteriales bacterium]
MIVRKATPQDQARIDELFAIAFEQPLKRGTPREESGNVSSWAAFTDDSQMMSTFSVTDFLIQFDGNHCKMGGIGGVATLPQFRRRGGIRGCFQAALPDMFENGYDFSYLYPFSTGYYRKFGYESCVQKLLATVDLQLLDPPEVAGHFRLAEAADPFRKEIVAIDRVWEEQFNMMVIHQEKDYDFTKRCDPAASQEFTYVYFSADGTPKAYTTFVKTDHRDGRNLVCTWLFFTDREGFYGLMNLFKSLSADHKYVKFVLPSCTAMQYLCPEWSLGAALWALQPGGMVRVVNVQSVLQKARYAGSGAVTLEVRDRQVAQNNRRFAVSFENGKAVSVEGTGADADLSLDIATFSALIAGVWDFADSSRWMGGLTLHRDNPDLRKVFYRKPLMLVDYF